MSDLIENLVDQVATAILSETPANYVSQSIAQAYRNAEIALAIIEPIIRADEREKNRLFTEAKAIRADEREKIAQAIVARREHDEDKHYLGTRPAFSVYKICEQIARNGGEE